MNSFPRWLKIATVLVMLGFLLGGGLIYRTQERSIRKRVAAELAAIARLKANQIRAWRNDRLADAALLSQSPFFAEGIKRWMEHPDPENTKAMLDRFRLMVTLYHCNHVCLTDTTGKVLLSLEPEMAAAHPEAVALIGRTFAEKRPLLTDLHRGPGKMPPHIDAVAPLFQGAGSARAPLGAVILGSEARDYLYPLIQSWPMPSRSAETLVVRRDGDSVLFLNELRFQKNAALSLRIPMTRQDLPAVKAAEGVAGIFEGRDYRGVPVLSVLGAIPGSDWFMVSKIDKSELFAEWRVISFLLVLIIFGLLAGVVTVASLIGQNREKEHYRNLLEAETSLRKSEERYEVTLMSIGDGVIVTDVRGRVEMLNPVSEILTGWSREDALGRPIDEVFPIVNEETRQVVENPVRRVVAQGVVVGLANHTVLLSRDGLERPIADSGAPIRDSNDEIIGAVLVFRDQTQERAAKKALEASEEFARGVLDGLSAHIAIVDETGKIEAVNRAWRHFAENNTALPGNACEGADYLAACDAAEGPDSPEARSVAEAIRAVLSGRSAKISGIEYPCSSPDEERWFTVRVTRFPGEGPPRVIVAHENITARKRAEIELRKNQVLLATILDSIPAPVFYKDQGGAYLGCNRAFSGFMGVPKEELIGKTVFDITPSSMSGRYHEADLALLESGLPQVYEAEVLHADGTRHHVIFHKAPFLNSDGSTGGIVGAMLDMTDYRKTQEALKTSEERNKSYVENAPYGVFVSDETGRFVEVNPEAVRFTGYGEDELLSMSIPDMLASESLEAGLLHFRHCMDSGRTFGEFLFRKKDGSLGWCSVAAIKISNTRILAFVNDISERKKAEADREKLQAELLQAQKMESIGRLAGGVAHDFNNMLQAILGQADLMLARLDPASPTREGLLEILSAAKRSADLTRQLLAFARKQNVAPRVLDLNVTVSGMTKMLRRLIGEDIELVFLPGPELWPVKVDPVQIDQVLANLAVNSRDAMSGSGRLTIETSNRILDDDYCSSHAECHPGEYVLLTVSDTGAGMDRETTKKIFEPFFTTKVQGKGTGLGLSTVYGIVKQNGGHISVYSEPGQGTTFTIHIPRCDPESAAAGAVSEADAHDAALRCAGGEYDLPYRPAADSLAEAPREGGETLLFVEDEATILKIGKAMLGRLGYKVLPARSPAQAIRLAEEHHGEIHLVITDVVMPEMNGRELATRLSALRPGIRCLYMSGYTANVIAHHGILDENVHFLQKPFSIKDMADKVREALEAPPPQSADGDSGKS